MNRDGDDVREVEQHQGEETVKGTDSANAGGQLDPGEPGETGTGPGTRGRGRGRGGRRSEGGTARDKREKEGGPVNGTH